MKDISRNNKHWIPAVFCLCFLLSSCGRQNEIYVEQTGEEVLALSDEPQETEEKDTFPDHEISRIYVQVSGAVYKPGVYELSEGSRVFEAIALAGGVTEEADERLLNQAQPLSDGQMLYVYAEGEAPEETVPREAQAPEDGRVNLNTASLEQLMELPGIGQAKAESILAFRKARGAFAKIEDVMEIEGIKEGVFSKIKDRIKVD